MMCLAITIAISVGVFAQENIGAYNGVTMWSVPDSIATKISTYDVQSALINLPIKAAKPENKLPGVYYIPSPDSKAFRYRSTQCEIKYPEDEDGGHRVYLEKEKVTCLVRVLADAKSPTLSIIVSTPDKEVKCLIVGKTRAFFLSQTKPDVSFFSKGFNALKETLELESKRYN